MMLEKMTSQILVAFLGGFAAELLHWYALSRRKGVIPKYRKKPIYWVTTLGMMIFGCLMPVLYIQGPASALLCFHLGAATPLIIQKLIANLPTITTKQGEKETSIRDFFYW